VLTFWKMHGAVGFGYGSTVALNLSSWNTQSARQMAGMFRNATTLDPDVSSFNTAKVLSFAYMFNNATNSYPDVSKWETSQVTSLVSIMARSLLFLVYCNSY